MALTNVWLQFAFNAKPSTVIRSATLGITEVLDRSRGTPSNSSRHLLGAFVEPYRAKPRSAHTLDVYPQLGPRAVESRFSSFKVPAMRSQPAGLSCTYLQVRCPYVSNFLRQRLISLALQPPPSSIRHLPTLTRPLTSCSTNPSSPSSSSPGSRPPTRPLLKSSRPCKRGPLVT